MAKIYSHNKFGIDFPNSYWRLTEASFDIPNRVATFTFTGYATAETRQAGASPIGQKTVAVKGAHFLSLYQLHMRGGLNIGRCAYRAAQNAGIFPIDAQDAL